MEAYPEIWSVKPRVDLCEWRWEEAILRHRVAEASEAQGEHVVDAGDRHKRSGAHHHTADRRGQAEAREKARERIGERALRRLRCLGGKSDDHARRGEQVEDRRDRHTKDETERERPLRLAHLARGKHRQLVSRVRPEDE